MASPISTMLPSHPLKVSVVGSGNFGSVIAKIVANNAKESPIFDDEVRMWVFEEMVNGEKLTEIINKTNENVKYLPNCKLPSNLVAVPDLIESCRGSDLLVFVTPHQFLLRSCDVLYSSGALKKDARAISCIKGLHVENGYPVRLSQLIENRLGVSECAVLSGANVANDIAKENFSECTIGYKNPHFVHIWQSLFDAPYFKVSCLPDRAGVELCGALKNIIALAAGFADGIGMGTNTKAAILRIGVEEMRNFSSLFFNGVLSETFLESAGVADVITTAFSGRNVRCAAEFVRCGGKKTWEMIEKEMLNGQKLQGTLTTREVGEVLRGHGLEKLFPLFECTYNIAFEGRNPEDIVGIFSNSRLRPIPPPQSFSGICLSPSAKEAQRTIHVDFDQNTLYPNRYQETVQVQNSLPSKKIESPCVRACSPSKPIVSS